MARTLPAKQHPFGHRAGSGAPPLGSPRVPREPKSLPAKKTVSFHLEVDDDSEGSSTSTCGGRAQSGTPDSLDFVAERPALPVRQAPTPSRAGPSTASWLSSPGSSQDHSVDVVHPGSPLLAGAAAGRRGEGVGEPPHEALGDAGGGAARGRCSGALRPPDQPGEPLDRALWQQACCDAGGAAPGWRSGAQGPLAEEHPVRQAPGEAGSHGCAVAELAEGQHSQQEASGEGGGGNAVLPGSCSRAPPRDAPGVSCESKARLARKTVSFNLEVDDHSEGPPTCGGRVQSGTPDSLDFVAERPALPVRQAPTPSRAGPSTASWLSSPGSSQDHSVDVVHPGSPLLAGAAAGRRGEGVGEPPQEALGDAGGGAARGRCSGALRPPDQPGEPLDRALWQQACCDAGGVAPGWRSGAQGPLAEEHPVRQAPGEAGSHGCAVAELAEGAPRSLAEGQHSQQEASGEGSAGVSAVLPGSCSEAPQRPSAERHRSQQEALRALQLLEERARWAAAALKSRPHRCTAATKWAFAHGVARGAPRIEAWGGGGRHASGAYDYLPGERAQGPPTYQSASDPSQRLRLSPEGHWLVGSADASEQQHRQWGYLRSAHPVEPGVLPHAVSEWDVVPGAGGGQPAASRVRFWLAETVRLEWQKARVASCDCPVVSVRGVGQLGDGLYDFVPREGSAGEPPAYQHQVQRNLWLYLASDQRWWVGTEEGPRQQGAPGPGPEPPSAAGAERLRRRRGQVLGGLRRGSGRLGAAGGGGAPRAGRADGAGQVGGGVPPRRRRGAVGRVPRARRLPPRRRRRPLRGAARVPVRAAARPVALCCGRLALVHRADRLEGLPEARRRAEEPRRGGGGSAAGGGGGVVRAGGHRRGGVGARPEPLLLPHGGRGGGLGAGPGGVRRVPRGHAHRRAWRA
ncbi:unnamed protein product [Prorocentrum cordatum]|uniref:Uncharacterized protein n=1 Tax=Prorocentrum cordatum TaxID=2364126 RepID=A0ABN9SF68_9DINO|nr:unnamed protein product [Polarella glacialis]